MSEPVLQKETRGFETEVSQLLDLMVHSLYSEPEIFLRELISNSSDALDKLRGAALTDQALYGDNTNLDIHIELDEEAHTVTVRDSGIGMNWEECVSHLGTIANSGTKAFLESLGQDKRKDAQLIGQFGVGFYSAFMVAESVTVRTRRAGTTASDGVCWTSEGRGEYTIEPMEKAQCGTEVVLKLKKEAEEFLSPHRLREIVRKYSQHICFPIFMRELAVPKSDDEETAEEKPLEFEQVNSGHALWAKPRKEIKDEEYKDFYQLISHDYNEPMCWSHNRVEGKLEYISLLYIPSRAPFDMFQTAEDAARGLKLYVQRVFIMDDAKVFLPRYLRFVQGIIDTNDLPLNVSREILQRSRNADSIRAAVTTRVLGMLEKMAKDESEKYGQFWQQFGQVLKEGVLEDTENKERIAKLLRFTSTKSEGETADVSLMDYCDRLGADEDTIYYITAQSYKAAANSPHLEYFNKKGIEVLLLHDPIDEWLVGHLGEFEGKKLKSVAQGDVSQDKLDEAEVTEQKAAEEAMSSVLEHMKKTLEDKVKDVRITHRLTDSPACVVADDNDMGRHLQRMLKAAGQDMPDSKPILEVNPKHALLQQLNDEQDDARFDDLSLLLLEQAILAEGATLPDPAAFVKRMNRFLVS